MRIIIFVSILEFSKSERGFIPRPGSQNTVVCSWSSEAPGSLFFFFCCRQCCLRATHVHKSASWSCHFSRTTCDFVRGRVGTYHEIPLTAAGLDLWGPCCQSLSLSCWVVLCNSLSSAPHPNTSWAARGVGCGWGYGPQPRPRGCQTTKPSGPTTVP